GQQGQHEQHDVQPPGRFAEFQRRTRLWAERRNVGLWRPNLWRRKWKRFPRHREWVPLWRVGGRPWPRWWRHARAARWLGRPQIRPTKGPERTTEARRIGFFRTKGHG